MKKKRYSCKSDLRGKVFSLSVILKRHTNTVHNSQKDHKCESYEKAFLQAGDLTRHINSVHNVQKDHKCDSYGKAVNLKKHIDTVIMVKKITNVTHVKRHFLNQEP